MSSAAHDSSVELCPLVYHLQANKDEGHVMGTAVARLLDKVKADGLSPRTDGYLTLNMDTWGELAELPDKGKEGRCQVWGVNVVCRQDLHPGHMLWTEGLPPRHRVLNYEGQVVHETDGFSEWQRSKEGTR